MVFGSLLLSFLLLWPQILYLNSHLEYISALLLVCARRVCVRDQQRPVPPTYMVAVIYVTSNSAAPLVFDLTACFFQ